MPVTITMLICAVILVAVIVFLVWFVKRMNKIQRTVSNMDREAIDALLTRRSVRKYKPEQVSRETLDRLLEIATYAPNGKGLQTPLIAVVQDKETTDRLRRMNAEIWGKGDIDPYYGAPTIIVVFAPTDGSSYVEDGSSVLTYLTIAAHVLGLGSCWVNRELQMFETGEGKAMKKAWGIPEKFVGIGGVAVGYVDGELPKPAPRKPDYVKWV
ncbi:MAG: nitroreductase [Clostridiales Family XIII bacterium]|nr:nitroreductase [Clostridiales Family XIII bacterium]